METKTNAYHVNRVRLINFHNFVNETVEIKNGGHLFILGDNASGKSTIIDAVHYVLTAGESMEFNSAARVAGRRSEGRRAQGIITRYNVDAGHLKPNGGVTYAALEISGRHGKPSTIALGMSVSAFEDNLNRWGVVRECPLEDIPFLIEDDKGIRPRTSREMRDALGKMGYYGQINSYKREIGDRFFGGEEMFRDFCRFLSMGKAYREIATHASDYHELFKNLLPPPSTGLFEQIIDALKKLDASRAEIEAMNRRLDYIRSITDSLLSIDQARANVDALEACRLRLDIDDLLGSLRIIEEEKRETTARLEAGNETIASLRTDKDRLDHELVELRERDVNGLIRRESELAEEIKAASNKLDGAKNKRSRLNTDIDKVKAELKTKSDDAKRQLDAIANPPEPLPERMADKSKAFSESIATNLDEASPETALDDNTVETRLEALRNEHTRLVKNEIGAANALAMNAQNQKELEEKARQANEEDEAVPELPGYAEALGELNDIDIKATPLYQGLEWKSGVDEAKAAAVEDLVGEETLAILLIDEDDHDQAADVIFADYPGVRLASKKSPAHSAPPWMNDVFDVEACDPRCLAVLSEELTADKPPKFNFDDDVVSIGFRSHQRGVSERPARFIGTESRRQERRRVIEETEEDLALVRADGKELREQQKAFHADLRLVERHVKALETRLKTFNDIASSIKTLKRDVHHLSENAERLDRNIDESNEELLTKTNRVEEIRSIIAEKKLRDVDERVRQTTQALKETEANLENAIRDNERMNREMDALASDEVTKNNALEERRREIAQVKERLRDDDHDPEAIIEKRKKELKLRTSSQARRAIEAVNRSTLENQILLRERLNAPEFSPLYGFAYEEDANQVVARDTRDVFHIAASLEKDIREQTEIINEKSSEIFRKIIMDELVKSLQKHVFDLDAMVESINARLENRRFGNNQYRFQMVPIDHYERLLDIIRHYNYLDPKCERGLREFFDDYRDEIIAAEVNEVPAMLDYRNWYHYEMKVFAADNAGKVMDRHMKSVGSGGEQAVPNYLLILTIAHFLFGGSNIKLPILLFDEAFYGIDAGRRDQLMGFATDLGLQLFVASPDQDGVKREIRDSTSIFIVKDVNYDVHLHLFHWTNPEKHPQGELFDEDKPENQPIEFGEELPSDPA